MRNQLFQFTSAVLLACISPCLGEVFVLTEFQGTPSNAVDNPTRTMPLWQSGLTYLVSDGGPILSAEFSGTSPGGYIRGIFGRMGQRWESSQSNGVYDVTSPGPVGIVNRQSDLSLDSHFLPITNGAFYTSSPVEGQVLFPGQNPVPSSPAVGYGNGVPPGGGVGVPALGFLNASLEIPLSANVTQIPLVYLTLGGGILFSGDVTTTDGTFRIAHFVLVDDVPEPVSGTIVVAAILLASRRQRGQHTQMSGKACYEDEEQLPS